MYYFAYGSNMVFEHMRRLCGWHFQVLGVAYLPDHEFSPDKRGYATVQPKAGEKVFGILYLVDQHCIDALDEFEGHPDVFMRVQSEVQDMSGKNYTVWLYAEGQEFFDGDYIKAEYLNRIIGAAEANRLPGEWVKFLKSFQQIAKN